MRRLVPHEPSQGVTVVGRPLLAVSDIHGDIRALDAVLDEVRDLDLCGIVAAGDHCLGGAEPFAVWRRLLVLGAHMVRGATDLALGSLDIEGIAPGNAREHARLVTFLRTREALGEIVCRRLAELPTTLVVSLDDRSGVMVMHGSPADEHRGLRDDLEDDDLAHLVGCVAEDVLVVGSTHRGFVRRIESQGQRWMIVNAGSVGMSPIRAQDEQRTAHAVLVQPYSDGVVRAFPVDVPVTAHTDAARARRVG